MHPPILKLGLTLHFLVKTVCQYSHLSTVWKKCTGEWCIDAKPSYILNQAYSFTVLHSKRDKSVFGCPLYGRNIGSRDKRGIRPSAILKRTVPCSVSKKGKRLGLAVMQSITHNNAPYSLALPPQKISTVDVATPHNSFAKRNKNKVNLNRFAAIWSLGIPLHVIVIFNLHQARVAQLRRHRS